jgi:uncharacterized protein YneF (UPF0154 family)
MKRRVRDPRRERWIQIIFFSILGGIFLGMYISSFNKPLIFVKEAEAATSTVSVVPVQIEVHYDWTRERIDQEIETAAKKYGVNASKMKATVQCESQYHVTIKSNFPGEDSWGLAQFHLPSRNRTADGKVMTKEMALNPIIALDTMAFMFSTGNARAWSCYRQLYK